MMKMSELSVVFGFIGAAIISIIVISNPLSTSIVYFVLTQDFDQRQKVRVARKAIEYALGILIFFAITGFLIFEIFGISIGAFRIAGGIMLFTIAAGMLKPAPRYEVAEEKAADIALIPLAVPFISGPGTIVTTVLLMADAQRYFQDHGIGVGALAVFGVFAGIIINIVVSYAMMVRSDIINKILKEGGRKVVTRILGLIVMAISIQFIINGIKDILPEFVEILGAITFPL